MQLTNADRRVLLDSFRALAADQAGEGADLIGWATAWSASLAPTFGFELNLTRDVFVLCETLRRAGGDETARLARGGLAYLYRNNHVDPLPLGPLGLLDDAFVAGYAAHAIRATTGEDVCYCPPRLGIEEQNRAETMFLELLDRPDDQDDVLPELAMIALGQLGNLLESGLFRRLRMNVHVLSHVLGDRNRSADHRQIARAALHYVAAEHDAIPDSLGLIGFLDDYFVADLAAGLIDPGQRPWMSLIDAAVGAWPFLNMVNFGDGRKGIPASEFLMVNAALTCPALRGSEPHALTHLVLPRTGPLPLLLGFLASLGELRTARQRGGSVVPYEVGQKILVDGTAVRTFAGCRWDEGRHLFGLERTLRQQGRSYQSIEWWPIDHLGRIAPAGDGRSARGKISFAGKQVEPLGPLDYLFLSAEPVTVPADLPRVVVVTPVGAARRLAESVSVFGRILTDTVPMGHLSVSGDVCYWSGRFGTTQPAVLVVPDLDRACEYVEREGDRVALTVVDASGHNAGRLASLSRLQGVGARVLVAVAQADADSVLEGDAAPLIWEWDRADFDYLDAGPSPDFAEANPVRDYEREVVRAVSAVVDVVAIPTPEVDAAFRAVVALKRLAEARGEDVPQKLADALDRSFVLLTRLLRCPFHLASHPRLLADLMTRLDALAGSRSGGVFLSEQERKALADAELHLRTLVDLLRERNPKEETLAGLRNAGTDVRVVCGDADLLDGADSLNVVALATLDKPERYRESGYAIAGWFGRGAMARLLRPPFATPLYLLLYGPEVAWRRSFMRQVREGTEARRGRSVRARLFPGVGEWADSNVVAPTEVDRATPAGETPDAIETYLLCERRNRLAACACPTHGEEAVEARLVTFDGGYAFLTDDYQAKLATHLLADEAGDDAQLEVVPARRLRRGDVLLFLRGSDRDVIRQVADQLLPEGEREWAGLWRQALLKYRERRNCSVEVVWRRLREHGCPLGLATIENWFADANIISPAHVSREVGAILALTQDADLRHGFDRCRSAITGVRGAHLRASHQLAKRVIDRAVTGLKSTGLTGAAVDLGEGIVLARVAEIDEVATRVRASAVNHLVEESSWPA